jgi:hypothetical protein
MSVQYEFSLVVAMMRPPSHTKAFEGAAVNPQVIGGQHSLAGTVQQARTAAGSNWNKGGRGKPPPFSRTCILTCLCHCKCNKSYLNCSNKWIHIDAIRQSVGEINARSCKG